MRDDAISSRDNHWSQDGSERKLVSSPSGLVSAEEYYRAASEILAMKPKAMETDLLGKLLKRHYGLEGAISVLSSEVECTAELHLEDGRRLIFKTSAQSEAMDSFSFQASALASLKGCKGFATPEIIPTGSGILMFQEEGLYGYLQTRIEGVPLHEAETSPDALFRTGQALGGLDLALRDIVVPAVHRPVLWHIRCWPMLTELETYLPAGTVASNVHAAMDDYVQFVEPHLSQVVWQVVHNDPSPFNTLVANDAIAFIDFGDGCWGPRIQDLAIAASHFVRDQARPLGGAEDLIAGYASALPVSAGEASLLVGLMKARQSALILVNHWRAHLFPADAAYIKKNVARAEHGLAILSSLTDADAKETVLRAIAGSVK